MRTDPTTVESSSTSRSLAERSTPTYRPSSVFSTVTHDPIFGTSWALTIETAKLIAMITNPAMQQLILAI
jgi:hypothetical protein